MASESMAAEPVYSVAAILKRNTAKLLYIVEKGKVNNAGSGQS